MSGQIDLPSGVIEGFYGRPWPHDIRLAYAGYLKHLGLNSYLYCPKADPFLRKRWQEPWPDQTRREIVQLARVYSDCGISWGVGLSPFALYQNYDDQHRSALKQKVEYLSALDMPMLAILFDDMPGDVANLASLQASIVTDVCAWAPRSKILVCPTYYSFDPVLEKYFGNKPEAYWQQLGEELPRTTDIFWTGNQVCSDSITGPDIDHISSELGRAVTLWDNYPVNDGAVRSNFIYSSSLSGRSGDLAGKINGHYCNPMNQPMLSLMALTGLADLYGLGQSGIARWLEELYGHKTYQQLLLDRDDFEQLGLSGMGARRCKELARLYSALPGIAAKEVADWLRGEYTFDPACLTD
jgi:hypothetical protein